jgi:sugar transferase EpsL
MLMTSTGNFYCRFGKCFLDWGCAVISLVILSPLLGILFLSLKMAIGSPVLFKQKRPGLWGKPFFIYKFRTMTDVRGQNGSPIPDCDRLTRIGKFLRSTSLDELPELFNVIKGDMSLVGPRPLLMQYLERYTPEQARRHEIKPGITGWAQINGRNAISWEEKFKMDIWYVENRSFCLDLKIIAKTIGKVLKRDGINQEGQATAEEFMGSYQDAKAQRNG